MSFDDVLGQVGDFGVYQQVMLLLLSFVSMPMGLQSMAMIFLGGKQDHWCRVQRLQNLTHAQQKYIAIPRERGPDDVMRYSQCKVFKFDYAGIPQYDLENWNRSLMVNESTPTVKCNSWVFDQTQYFSTVLSEWQLVCDQEWLVAMITTIYMAGQLVGGYVAGDVADRYGRHRTMVVFIALQVVFTTSAAFAPNYALFVTLRFCAAFTISGAYYPAFVLLMEICGSDHREKAGMIFQSFFCLGVMIFAGLGFAFRNHLHLQLAMAVPFCLLISFWCIVPESPRWLVSKKRFSEAQKVLALIAKINKKPPPEMLHNVEEESTTAIEKQHNVLDLVRTPNMRKISLIIFFGMMINSMVYNGISLNTDTLGDNIYMNTFLCGLVDYASNISGVFIMKTLGRVRPMMVGLLVCGIAMFGCIPLYNNKSLQPALLTVALVGRFGVAVSIAILLAYASEIFPTVIRNTGVGAAAMFSNLGGIVAPQISRLNTIWYSLPSVIFGVTALVASVAKVLLPDTKGRDLPETIEDGENFGKKPKSVVQFTNTSSDLNLRETKSSSCILQNYRAIS